MPDKDCIKKKEAKKKHSKKYYEANKEKIIQASNKAKKARRAEFYAFKSRLSCTKCGENHPATLDFHHIVSDPANKKITDLIRAGRINFAMEEIMNKCIVLCSNCHRKHHYDTDKKRRARLPER
jgi:5-methylcytosine-specific restriction endonuclease McrA